MSLNYERDELKFQTINCHQFIQKCLHNYIPKDAFYEFYAPFFGYAKQLAWVGEVMTDEYNYVPFLWLSFTRRGIKSVK